RRLAAGQAFEHLVELLKVLLINRLSIIFSDPLNLSPHRRGIESLAFFWLALVTEERSQFDEFLHAFPRLLAKRKHKGFAAQSKSNLSPLGRRRHIGELLEKLHRLFQRRFIVVSSFQVQHRQTLLGKTDPIL